MRREGGLFNTQDLQKYQKQKYHILRKRQEKYHKRLRDDSQYAIHKIKEKVQQTPVKTFNKILEKAQISKRKCDAGDRNLINVFPKHNFVSQFYDW